MEKNLNSAQLIQIATQVRRDILRMVHAVQSGHPGGSLGCTDFMVAMYFKIMNYKSSPFRIDGKDEDVFILSNGHISPLFYSVLARTGHFSLNELKTFRKLNSRLQGHPATHYNLEGVRIATGSLGQGLSVALGMALSKKLKNDKNIVYCLMGDGELEEGQNWEAIMFASHNKVDNLIAVVDFNRQQIDGSISEIMGINDYKSKFEAFGWQTFEMNGNNMDDILANMKLALSNTGKGKPIMINMKTEMGAGVDFMTGTHEWHGIAPSNEQLAKALEQLPETIGDY
ncbi:MAG: transketolase [Bacteroidetes bacterium]|nr:transketolase [Bacteroidota bacterium]